MPKDVEIVRDKVSEIFSGNYFEAKISVVPDSDVKDGGVIVETSNGLIDASINTQLTIIEKALKKQEEVQSKMAQPQVKSSMVSEIGLALFVILLIILLICELPPIVVNFAISFNITLGILLLMFSRWFDAQF